MPALKATARSWAYFSGLIKATDSPTNAVQTAKTSAATRNAEHWHYASCLFDLRIATAYNAALQTAKMAIARAG